MARDIRSQYTIGYHSTKPASLGGYRLVKVEAHAQGYGKLIVRTRTGYYPRVKSLPGGKGNEADARQPSHSDLPSLGISAASRSSAITNPRPCSCNC